MRFTDQLETTEQHQPAARRSILPGAIGRRILNELSLRLGGRRFIRHLSLSRSGGERTTGAPKVQSIDRRCPDVKRVMANRLSAGEWHHVENCPQCQDAAVRYHEATQPRLRRITRRVRLALLDWNPFLQCATLLMIIATAAWGAHYIRAVNRASAPQRAVSSAPLPTAVPPPSAILKNVSMPVAPPIGEKSDKLAAKIAPKLSWPWTECDLDQEAVNKWLGEGVKRMQIENNLATISRGMPKGASQRHEAAQHWCKCLAMGSRALAAETRRQADNTLGLPSPRAAKQK